MMKKVVGSFLLSCLLVTSVFSQKNIDLRSVYPYTLRLSDVWGYADSMGNEYALVGVQNGLSIVNVTDPDNVSQTAFIPGASSIWRDIKTWKHYAYVTNETGDGLLIVDMNTLPNPTTAYWTADTLLHSAHNLYIDENGYAYIFGFNTSADAIPTEKRGALIANLNPNPMSPVKVGTYEGGYIHDGFVRGDTLWASETYNGYFSVIDVSNKANPQRIATQLTPGRVTHNCWPSEDGNYLFTTDETSSGTITSFDVSDLGNITELDRYEAVPASGLIPHNTHVIGDYLVNSMYKYGVSIVDATHPDNLVEIGYYDTSTFPPGDGFAGCWGAYPFLPSGTLLASDIEEGLFVMTPSYQRAAYLAGQVTDATTTFPLNSITVELMGTGHKKSTGLSGYYKTGTAEPGMYDVRFYKTGCVTKIVTNVELFTSLTTTLNQTMSCTATTAISSALYENTKLYSAVNGGNSISIFYELQGDFAFAPATLQLFDAAGRSVGTYQLTDLKGEVELGNSWRAGLYIARLSVKDESKLLKFIKN